MKRPTTVDAMPSVSMSNYLHDAVPVVAGGNAEECQERHAKVAEVSVLVEPDARVFQRTFYARRRDIYLFIYLI